MTTWRPWNSGLGGEHSLEKLGRQKTQWRLEVVEEKLGVVVGRVSVAGELLALDPVGDGEVKGWACGEVHD